MQEDIHFWHLQNHKLFRTLSRSQTKELCIISCFRKLKKGNDFIYNDFDEPRIFFLKKGNVKLIQRDESGNETISEILKQGEIFGEIISEDSHKYDHIAKAISNDVIFCSFYQKDFDEIMTKYPELALSFSKFIGLKFKKLKNNYNNLFTKDAYSRLGIFLANWYIEEGKEYCGEKIIENYLTQDDIAQLICCSRQTTSQLIQHFEEDGLIKYSRKEIILKDFEKILSFVN